MKLDEPSLVKQPKGLIQKLALKHDPLTGAAPGHLVGDRVDRDDVVGADAAAKVDNEAAAKRLVTFGKPQRARILRVFKLMD